MSTPFADTLRAFADRVESGEADVVPADLRGYLARVVREDADEADWYGSQDDEQFFAHRRDWMDEPAVPAVRPAVAPIPADDWYGGFVWLEREVG